MPKWSKFADLVPLLALMAPMQFRAELFLDEVTPLPARQSVGRFAKRKCGRNGFRAMLGGARDMASPLAGVMLHLRFCYVSKAAILTVPVQLVPVGNRSPA